MLSRLNLFLSDRSEHGKYATLFYSQIDSSGLLTFANAGHCTPLLARASGEIEKLDATSPPVGLIPGASFTTAELQLRPGDRLVLYSDGVPKRRIRKASSTAGDACAMPSRRRTARTAADCMRQFDNRWSHSRAAPNNRTT